MKARLKRITVIACIMALVVTMMPANIMTAKAASVKGTKIEVNQTYTGVLAEEDEVDWYTFEFTQNGYFTAEFNPVGDVGKLPYGWDFIIYNQDEKELYSSCTLSKDTSVKLAFATGIYYIRIDACNGRNEPTGYEYNLRVNTVESSTWECESNDMISTADEIVPGTEYHGTLYYNNPPYSSADVDYYKVNFNDEGYFTVEFDSDSFGGKTLSYGWNVTIYNQDEKVLDSFENVLEKTTSVRLAFDPGTYYIKVGRHTYDSLVDVEYKIKVNSVSSSNWERESNDMMSTADEIRVGNTYFGTLYFDKGGYFGGDDDYYKVKVGNKGYFNIEFDSDSFGDKNLLYGWDMTVYDDKGNSIKEYSNILSKKITGKFPFPQGEYYIRISRHGHSEAPIDRVYSLKVNSVKSSIWECESNNSMNEADKITVNSKTYYKGSSYLYDDEDYFKFTVPSKGDVQIRFKAQKLAELTDKNAGWYLYLYNSSGTKLQDLGEFTKLKSVTVNLPKGTYYLRIVPDGYDNAPVDATYNFKISHCKKPAKPTITKISSKKKTVTIKWKKVANATGYKVFAKVGKNGKYKVVKTIKNNKTVSFTHKKLKKGKTYYYKVQVYTTKNGMTSKSAQSKYKAIVIK